MIPAKHTGPDEYNSTMAMAIIGGGRRCLSLLQMLQSDALKGLRAKIVGVAGTDPNAVGYRRAELLGIFTTPDFQRLFDMPDLDLVINLTGSAEVTRRLTDLAPASVSVFPIPLPGCSRKSSKTYRGPRDRSTCRPWYHSNDL